MGRYSANVVFALVALVAIGGLLHLATAPAPAQHGANVHVTGKVVDKLLKHFEGSHGLTGVRAIDSGRSLAGRFFCVATTFAGSWRFSRPVRLEVSDSVLVGPLLDLSVCLCLGEEGRPNNEPANKEQPFFNLHL